MRQRTVLCYGDSNTWGFDPVTKERFGPMQRWTGILQESLGPSVRIIEEGLNGRTTVFDDPLQPGRNGLDYLVPCLDSHSPVDLLVLMLGTNDLKRRFALSAEEISLGAARLIAAAQGSRSGANGRSAQVLLLSPPLIGPLHEYAGFFEGAESKSAELARYFRRIAEETGCRFLDTAPLVRASEVDGVHLDPSSHATLARALAEELPKLLAPG